MKEEKYLFSLQNRGIRLGLERTQKLLEACQLPNKENKIIQILGTNGKGSTSAILSNILKNNGYKVGLYTSPHIYSFVERIRVNGIAISINEVSDFLNKHRLHIDNLEASFFETMTVMALWYFKKSNVDYAIMETGLGGKFDSVTACGAKIFGITSISIDHESILGDNLEDIANEKIAAIRKESSVFYVNQKKHINKIIEDYCNINKCGLKKIKTNFDLQLSLPGDHQKQNASLAAAIAKSIIPDLKNINSALLSTKWFGRNQIIKKNPYIIFDVAHNEDGMKSFLKYINNINCEFNNKFLILSIQKTKNINKVSKELSSYFDNIIYTITDEKKSMDFNIISKQMKKTIFIKSPIEAIDYALSKSTEKDLICILGTHFWGEAVKTKFNISFDNL